MWGGAGFLCKWLGFRVRGVNDLRVGLSFGLVMVDLGLSVVCVYVCMIRCACVHVCRDVWVCLVSQSYNDVVTVAIIHQTIISLFYMSEVVCRCCSDCSI